ncbi:ArnT family glycosyltransferase [Gaoshiqia sp. Z1-71]|uniref:ArnT family glycosyltransferase n=1 Tax=Gaoshiqia hydrogeniformans TaxID=3290090 RepID=UPI003BF848B8
MKKLVWLVVAVGLYLLVNVSGLFVPMIVNAAKYAQVGREILDNHDWINLTVGGEAYDQKPPLLFWIAAVTFKLFGISGIAYKLVILLFSLIGVYATFKLGELLYDKRTGSLAAFFWATCLGYVHFHNDIHTDTLLVVPVMLSIWQYAAYFKKKKEYHFYLGTVFVGLAMLDKGPVGMVIPGAAVGLHLLLTRNFKAIVNYRWLVAIPIVALLILPAIWGLYKQFGPEGVKFYFWTNNMGRITGSYHGRHNDPFFYFHTTLYMIAPWAVFGFVGLFMQIREKVKRKLNFTGEDEFFTLGGILVYLLIASVAKQQNPHYEMAVLPLILILGARWAFLIFELPAFNQLKKVIGYIHLVIGILLFLLIFPFITYFFQESKIWIWAVVVILAGAFVYILSWKNSLNKQLSYLLISGSALLFILNTSILPNMGKYHSSFAAVRTFNEETSGKEELHIYTEEGRYWEIFFYSKNYGRYMVTPKDYMENPPAVNDWLYTGPEGLEELEEMNVKVDTVKVLSHRSLSRMSLKFLNPKTRKLKLETRYLLRVRGAR